MATFVADENIERQIVESLRERYDVRYVAEDGIGSSDEEVLDTCNGESAILLTADKDFGDLVFRQGRAHHGVILLRLAGVAPSEKARMVRAAIDAHVDEMRGSFTVLSSETLRIRKAFESQ